MNKNRLQKLREVRGAIREGYTTKEITALCRIGEEAVTQQRRLMKMNNEKLPENRGGSSKKRCLVSPDEIARNSAVEQVYMPLSGLGFDDGMVEK